MDIPDFTLACLLVGVLLIGMTMGGSFVSRLPLSAAMLYLLAGLAMGPDGLGLIRLNAFKNTLLLERLAEVAVLISLFTSGLKLELPLGDKRWRIPLQLASVAMLLTVAAVAAVGVWLLHLPLGAAVLLGAILAPTDPVLASDVQVANPDDRDRLRFGLTGEGGLNDGTAFPLVLLGLGWLGLHELGFSPDGGLWRWWTVDVLWAVLGGLGLGYAMGQLVGSAIVFLRTRHREALGSDEFIALGLIALTYGLALLTHTYGFLAVFAAGLALRRINQTPINQTSINQSLPLAGAVALAPTETPANPPTDEPKALTRAVARFNTQLESFVEVAMVLAVGALISTVQFRWEVLRSVLWLVPLLFLVIRPLAVRIALAGTGVVGTQRTLMGWFGIRGIGSLYYLMYAISHGLPRPLAEQLLSITLAVIAFSVIAHGLSVTPLMNRYERKKLAVKR